MKIKSDEKLKIALNKCKDHEDNAYCGWCDECGKNLCFLCISEELRKNHKYTLYIKIIPLFNDEILFND